MKLANGVAWLPDDETDSVMLGAGVQYQGNKLRAALKYVKTARRAVDIGAHCGLWSVQLGQYFDRVDAFEPLDRHTECWERNVGWKKSCTLHKVALGDKSRRCGVAVVEGLSGRSRVCEGDEFEMRRLDEFEFDDVDFLKADVEGYEYFALKGGENTLLKCKPVMVIECKPQHGGASSFGVPDRAAIDYLESLGAVVREEIIGDYVLTWGKP